MIDNRPKPPPGDDWRDFTPDDSPLLPPDLIASPVHQDLATPKLAPGDRAFDFDLPVYDFSDGTRGDTDRRFHLQSVAANRPVALVFGSYT
jgi:hypothetical protein